MKGVRLQEDIVNTAIASLMSMTMGIERIFYRLEFNFKKNAIRSSRIEIAILLHSRIDF